MSVRIRLRCDVGAFTAGQVASVSPDEAERLIGASAAELVPDVPDEEEEA